MSSYQIPIKHNNEFSTIFNNVDYDVSLSSKSNPILFNDARYLKSSGTIVSSSSITNTFNALETNSLKSKQIIDSFTTSAFSSSMTFDISINMQYYLEISSLLSCSLFFTNLPTTAQQSYTFLFLIKPTTNSKFYIIPTNNVLSINATSYPLYGISNVIFSTTFNYILQKITIVNLSTTTTPNFIATTSIIIY